jgi:hypothetical protein
MKALYYLIAGLRSAFSGAAHQIALPLVVVGAALMVQPCGAAPLDASWTETDSLSAATQLHTATLLPDAKVLVAGGFGVVTELYDPAAALITPD